MTDVRAISAYTAAKPVTPVVAAHSEKTPAKTETKTSEASHGPAVKVTLSAEATKALEAAQKAAATKTAAATKPPEKHETTAKPATPAAKAPEKHETAPATAHK